MWVRSDRLPRFKLMAVPSLSLVITSCVSGLSKVIITPPFCACQAGGSAFDSRRDLGVKRNFLLNSSDFLSKGQLNNYFYL